MCSRKPGINDPCCPPAPIISNAPLKAFVAFFDVDDDEIPSCESRDRAEHFENLDANLHFLKDLSAGDPLFLSQQTGWCQTFWMNIF